MVAALLENKADVHARDSRENTPLHLAAQNGNFLLMIRLMEHDYILLKLINLGHEKIAKLLIEKGAIVDERNTFGETALLESAYQGSIYI